MFSSRSSLIILLGITVISLLYLGCRTSKPVTESIVEAESVPVDTVVAILPDINEIITPPWIEPRKEFRAVWVATVANIDWPSAPGLPVDQQKQELIDILDRAAALHFNAIILQVRPAADALYSSPYEPWSYYLTGKMGQSPLPAYDPLEFAIFEAHKRGLALHAWFNPYRALHPTNRSEISPDHISITHPEYVHQYGDFLWMDPGIPEVKEHTLRVILDVVERYDIDGVHFDDYFYPYPSYANGADFPDNLSWNRALENGTILSRSDWRRENVNFLMRELSERIKQIKPHVKFGISPFGIWRPGYPEQTTGFDAYNQLYADARLWLMEGWVDYFSPQLYFRMDQIPQPFPVMLQWWAEQNVNNRHLWPGLFSSRLRTTNITWPVEEITGQVYTSRGFPGVTGMVHFSMRTFMENSGNINRMLAAGPHSVTSVIPPSNWLGNQSPVKPIVTINDYEEYWTLYLQPGIPFDEIRWYVVRKKYSNRWETEVVPASRIETVYYGGKAMMRPERIVVSALNRVGLESISNTTRWPLTDYNDNEHDRIFNPQVIARSEWANRPPSGLEANGVRLNILPGDTLRFRDLTLIYTDVLHSIMPPDFLSGSGIPASSDATTSETASVRISMYRNGVSENLSLKKTETMNWYGFQVGLLDVNPANNMAQFEIAATTSLPVSRASILNTGNISNRFRVQHNIHGMILHHTCIENPDRREENPAEILRALLNQSMDYNNLWDIPYHYLIDLQGNIYEGRNLKFAGDTNTTFDPRGHILLSLLGNHDLQEPTVEQIDALAELVSMVILEYGISPENINGYNLWTDTSCHRQGSISVPEHDLLKELMNKFFLK